MSAMRRGQSAWLGPLAIAATYAALCCLERRFPLRKSSPSPDRARVPRNLIMAVTVAAEVSLIERPLIARIAKQVENRHMGLIPALGLRPGASTLLTVILMDYTLYWWHVLLHKIPFLWRSHIVHHADLVLDSSTALRFHPWEFLASVPWRIAQVVLLGVRPRDLALWQRLTLTEVIFHHSNVRLAPHLDKTLRHFIVTPTLHGIHHSVVPAETNSNFSSGLTLWDKLHKTYRADSSRQDIEIGVAEWHHGDTLKLRHLLLMPFQGHPPALNGGGSERGSARLK